MGLAGSRTSLRLVRCTSNFFECSAAPHFTFVFMPLLMQGRQPNRTAALLATAQANIAAQLFAWHFNAVSDGVRPLSRLRNVSAERCNTHDATTCTD